MRTLTTVVLLFAAAATGQTVDQTIRSSWSGEMGDASLFATAQRIEAKLDASPNDNNAQAALGVVLFLRSGEGLLQRMYTHGAFNLPVQASMIVGAGGDRRNIGFNSEPEPITHEQFRQSIRDWIADVARAEGVLAAVGDDELTVRLPIGLARFDLNMDGEASDREQLWRMLTAVQRQFRPSQEEADVFEIAFDRGDVAWLRGYCNVCMAAGEFLLAHDTSDLFERAGHLFFSKNETQFEFLKGTRKSFAFGTGIDASDIVAFVHLMSFEVVDPERMSKVRMLLLETIRLAHEMGRYYDAETDDDREWIPNPTQRDCVIPGADINEEMRDVWLRTLAETEDMLHARRLLRFWRGNGEQGINVRRFFLEPRRFDLLLWVQGSAAAPFLEEGEFTSDGLWRDIERTFDRSAFRYMWWMN